MHRRRPHSMRRVYINLCPALISASIMAANVWENSLKWVESDSNKILYENLFDFLYSDTVLTFWISLVIRATNRNRHYVGQIMFRWTYQQIIMTMTAYEQLQDNIYIQYKNILNKRGRVKCKVLLKPIQICRNLEKRRIYCYNRASRFFLKLFYPV